MMAEESDEILDALIYKTLAQFYIAISDESRDYVNNFIISKRILEETPAVFEKILSLTNLSDFRLTGFSILDLAMGMGTVEVFNYLVEKGANLTAHDDQNNTIVHQALRKGVCNSIKQWYEIRGKLTDLYASSVLTKQMNSKNLKNVYNNNGMSHFHVACMINNVAIVKYFLDNGQAVNEAINADSVELPGYTPLHLAARYCAFDTIEVLLDYGADIHLTDANGITALHLLIHWSMQIIDWVNMGKRASYDQFMKDFDMIQPIIKMMFKKNGNFKDGLTLFHIACTMKDTEAVETLLKNNVPLDSCISMDANLWPGYTGLHFAAHFNFDIFMLVLDCGGNIFKKDAKGISPFDLCLQRYEAENIYVMLISQPAWKEIQFVDNQTKLVDLAFSMKDLNSYTNFLSNMPNVNTSIPLSCSLWPGCTPLHIAVIFAERTKNIKDLYEQTDYNSENSLAIRYNCSEEEENLYTERINACLNLNADVTMQDEFGSTPVHLAYRFGRLYATRLLLQYHEKLVNVIDGDGLSHLHVACAVGKNNFLADKLLFGGADVNGPIFFKATNSAIIANDNTRLIPNHPLSIPLGSTPLHIAVAVEDKKLIELLVQHGANLYAKDVDGLTPINLILTTDSLGSSEEFPTFFENLKNVTVSGFTSLHVAAILNKVSAVGRILEFGVDVEAAVGHQDGTDEIVDLDAILPKELKEFEGYRALHFAVQSRSRDMVEILLAYGANILAKSDDGLTPLYMSLNEEYTTGTSARTDDLFAEILNQDYNLQEILEEETGLTMLHVACHLGDTQLVEELVGRGIINPNGRTLSDSPIWPNSTPLRFANKHQSMDILQLLLDKGADVTMDDGSGRTPILDCHDRMHTGRINYAAMDILLAAHRDYTVNPSFEGVTHFHVACARNAITLVEGFLNNGVDINFPVDYNSEYDSGNTPLHYAIKYASMDTVDLLMARGANVQVKDVHGETPLHFVFRGNVLSMALLERIVSNGAYVNARNIYGTTPFELLLNHHSTIQGMIELFLRHTSYVNVFNPVTGVGLIALALNQDNRLAEANVMNRMEVMEMFINSSEFFQVDDLGRNALHNIVSNNGPTMPPENQYIHATDNLLQLGCDIDAKDYLGRTPLHYAVRFKNYQGIAGLLECGANLNLCDRGGESAFACSFKYIEESEQIILLFMTNFSMRRFVGLQSSQQDLEYFARSLEALNLIGISEEGYREMVEKLKLERIGTTSVALHDFLSETGAVAAYPHIVLVDRQVIENFFENSKEQLRREYPLWSQLLLLQYRKAQARLALMPPAKESLYHHTKAKLDEICYFAILRFLSNEELADLIASSTIQESDGT